MANLLEKFEASAKTRLAGHAPSKELGRYKAFLKVESHRLKLQHRAGNGGRDTCQARSLLVDVLIRQLWDTAIGGLSAQAQKEFPQLALVALGGYGRGELNVLSDLDIMFLHNGQVAVGTKPLPHLAKLIDGILTPLWDLGFKVGSTVRTIADCVDAANSKTDPRSMESKTALLQARLVVGDSKLFDRLQKTVQAKCVNGHVAEYIAARMQDQADRHARFGNSATMQEPNIKNGCGGLRDLQSLHWMAVFKYGTKSLTEMLKRELITSSEKKQLDTAYDYLLAVRDEMHYLAPSPRFPSDKLTKALQPTVATNFGHTDRSPSRRLERFMRDLYGHMRNVFLITQTLEERLSLLPNPQRFPSLRTLGRFLPGSAKKAPPKLLDGFKIAGGQIHPTSARVFRDQPRRLMRIFLHAQQRGLRLHPDAAQLIRNNLHLADRSFLHDKHVRETFLEILNQRGNVAPILRSMHDVGLLGKYIPEFGKLTCLVQHEFYHQYTADEHTLMCLTQLDRVWESQAPVFVKYAEVFRDVEHPYLLYLALLLHDAGKAARTGNHSEVSGRIAARVASRLALDNATTRSLRILVEQHLAMILVSQRRDLEDPMVIRHFAALIRSIENLRMLALLTFTDSMATSDKLWNGFKDSLLWTLYHKTFQALSGGSDFIRAEEKHRELLLKEVSRILPRTLQKDEIEGHFSALPIRYFKIHQAREIAADLALVHRFMHRQINEDHNHLEPVVSWHNEPDRGYTTAKLCSWNSLGLFSIISGSFSTAGINILSAKVFSRSDGIVLDSFSVTHAATGGIVKREPKEKFEAVLAKALADKKVDIRGLKGKQTSSQTLYQSLTGERLPNRIFFDNDTCEDQTVIDVEAEDDLGLLYVTSKALAKLGLDISLAKISTEKGAALDSFYVAEPDGQKILRPERQREIADTLLAALKVLQ